MFTAQTLELFSDIELLGVNLYDLYRKHGENRELDYNSAYGNRVIVKGALSANAMKNTTIYFNGRGNTVELHDLRNVIKLDIACIGGGKVSLASPIAVRGVTLVAAHGGHVNVGRDCLFSRDILLYATKSHGLYSVKDGSRRAKDGIDIADRVWFGQGVKVLTGASVDTGSVIGSYSVLAGKIPNNCAAAGNPCRVTTRDIFWTNQAAPNNQNYYEMLEQQGKERPEFIQLTQPPETAPQPEKTKSRRRR